VITFLLALAVTLVVTTLGHKYAREMVSKRLRYVPAAQSAKAPIIAGVGAALLALPLVPFLPLVGLGTAIVFGLAVGMGAAAGARDVKGRLGGF
jgi:hypothetical protein